MVKVDKQLEGRESLVAGDVGSENPQLYSLLVVSIWTTDLHGPGTMNEHGYG
jgi:hypothetical protein